MRIKRAYRRIPGYFAVPAALLASAVLALTLAVLGAVAFDSFLGIIHGVGELGDGILAFFYVGPSIAVLVFVSCFAVLINSHHATSWRAPTFAFAMGAILVWVWAQDWIGFLPFIPGVIAWLLSCWLLRRTPSIHPQHAIQA